MQTAHKQASIQTYSRARTVHVDAPPAEVRDRLVDALGLAGFSVLAEIDLADILRRRIDVHLTPHFVLEVCRPDFAHRALSVASDASLLLPCRIGVWAEGTGTTVGMIPPTRLLTALGREHLDAVARDAEERLDEILAALLKPGHRPVRHDPPAPIAAVSLSQTERSTVVEALRQRIQALLVEAAGTEKHDLQHALAQNIEQLETAIRKLEGGVQP